MTGPIVAGLTGEGVRFTVYGHPVTQGSMRGRRQGAHVSVVHDNAAKLEPWRQDVARAAQVAGQDAGITFGATAVEVLIEFRFPMKAGASKGQREVGLAFRQGRKDDVDKLVRAVLDGLTSSGLIADDGHVVDLHATKREHAAGWTGADVTVRPARLFADTDA